MASRTMPDQTSPYDNMSTAYDGDALQNGQAPYARSYFSPYTQYPGWQQQETPVSGSDYRKSNNDYQIDGAKEGLTQQGIAWYGRDASTYAPTRPNHLVQINDKYEHVAIADEGPLSKNPTPPADGRDWSEPSNDSGKWQSGRFLRAGIGYTFYRFWADVAERKAGGTADYNGAHISLADNAVVNPVGGMNPVYTKNKRNTYRIEPEPWDLNYVDMSADPTQNVTPPTSAYVPPNVSGTSYRLG